MEWTSERLATALDLYADRLEADDGGRFRVKAYRRAADAVARTPDVARLVRSQKATSIDGVGAGIASKLERLVGGHWPELEEAVDELSSRSGAPGSLRGDLHMHTTATDGRDTIHAMAAAADGRGYEYVAITDHTKTTRIAGGLDEDEMLAHMQRIRRAQEHHDVQLLAGAEVDILKDGSLDLPDEVLAQLDVVVCSIHFRYGMDGRAQTERILHAMENPHADILAHPTARRSNRPPLELDLPRIFDAAADQGWAIEMNGSPDRLDLRASDVEGVDGVFFSLSSDAHSTQELANIHNAWHEARKAGRDQILNGLPVDGLRKRLRSLPAAAHF